ncbi:Phosphorylated carbohydrates phosphatase [Streptomyces sp. ADI96-02]|uniref:HAD family hydrolase n=1 Tax=Streptomyces sp. ADI96-02 TaxID=1522760 RepID=UPI000F5504A7|nr:HAD family phosphatase [Streptomyces sp. ADI96-02]RPK54561.1 Phosphorylated carbohydrates phosphatase [Streptomyces sp. ADI96-02]
MTNTTDALFDWSPEAVVFDCDGTLMDTERHWQDARNQVFRGFGITPAPGFAERAKGVHYTDCGRLMAEESDKPHLVAEMTDSLLHHFMLRVADDPVTMPGAVEFVRRLSGRLPLAVASNCPLKVVEASLDRAGLLAHFGHIVVPTEEEDDTRAVRGEPVRPKPWPDVYATAARLCGAAPERALAVEDSMTGIESARRAGLRVLGVGPHPGQEDAARADLWVTTLHASDLTSWVESWPPHRPASQ